MNYYPHKIPCDNCGADVEPIEIFDDDTCINCTNGTVWPDFTDFIEDTFEEEDEDN